jgi:hypothetical protein
MLPWDDLCRATPRGHPGPQGGQVGERVRVTENGFERLRRAKRELFRLG